MPLNRRQFLGRTALAAGAALCPSLLRAGPADLTARTADARKRFARVAAFINESHPDLRAKILRSADEAMRGLLLLPGSSTLSSVGEPPAWLVPQHGDEEFLWGLNRMMHWKTLLQAHALTGDDRYAAKVASELDDWIARTQPPSFRHADGTPNPEIGTNAGPPPWRELEVGIRMFDSWPVVFEQLAGTRHLPPERLARVRASVAQHGESISLLSPLLWPEADHNHYFMEMLGLLAIGVYFPELNPTWTDQALRELQRCVEKQFTSDGGHIEACPTYHNVCVVLLVRYLVLARASGRPLPAAIASLVEASGGQTLHSVRPTGLIVPWGDSTRSNQVEAALWLYRATGTVDLLQHLAGLMGRAQVKAAAAPHLWDIDDPAALFAQLGRRPALRPLVRRDRDNDQVMARTSWERDALSVFFSCHSPLVPGSGHQHIDLGGFDFTALGRTLVADPGVFTYREGADRRLFKSAEYHSVLTIDGRGPFEYLSRWRYSPQQEGRVTNVSESPGMVRMDSFHRNYAPAICRRTLALVDSRLLVVIDSVEDIAPASTVQIYFHLDSVKVSWDQVANRALTDDAGVKLALYGSGGLQGELLPGRISDSPDTDRPSTRLRLADQGGAGQRVYATVLVPFSTERVLEPVTELTVSVATRACVFRQGGRQFSVPFA